MGRVQIMDEDVFYIGFEDGEPSRKFLVVGIFFSEKGLEFQEGL
jgi:hypothetical protein